MTLKMLMIISFLAAICFGCGTAIETKKTSTPQGELAGNYGYYIPEGYENYLKEKGLSEIAPMPYFKSPFITVAKDTSGDRNQQ